MSGNASIVRLSIIAAILLLAGLLVLFVLASAPLYFALTSVGLVLFLYVCYRIIAQLGGQRTVAAPRRSSLGDLVFMCIVVVIASAIPILSLIYFYELISGSLPTILAFGFSFVTTSVFDSINNVYGVYPELMGSLVTTAIALLIGVPVSIGVAVFLSEVSPGRIRPILSFLVEMLAAVPSVVYGIWGLFILAPFLTHDVYPNVEHYLGFIPIFSCPDTFKPCYFYTTDVMSAGIILSIMMIPIIAAISRDALQSVPDSQREAAYALGATKSEAVNMSVLSYARPGVIAAVFLGFARAYGETMAVTFLIGNATVFTASLFSPGYTLAAIIANQFTEATGPLNTSALIEAGLLLLAVSFAASFLGRLIIRKFVKSREASSLI